MYKVIQLKAGHDLIDHALSLHYASMPEQIKVTAVICKHILCDCDERSASCSGI